MQEPEIKSRPYKIGAACEKCCFGSGEHPEWCENGKISAYVERVKQRGKKALRELLNAWPEDMG